MAFGRRTPLTLVERAKNILWPRAGVGRLFRYAKLRLQRLPGTPHFIALGFACGVATSFTPFIGFHFLLAGLVAYIVGGSIIASAIGTFVGNPWTFPVIWISTFRLGLSILGRDEDPNLATGDIQADQLIISTEPGLWDRVIDIFLPMTIGSLPLGLLAGIITYLIMRPAVATYQIRRRAKLAARLKRQQIATMDEVIKDD